MLVTWTVLRTAQPVARVPWQPDGARWSQGGHCGAGRADAPVPDGTWWSVLATWDDPDAADAGPPPADGVDVWHLVLEVASWRGDAVLAGGARPFDDAPRDARVEDTAAVVTFAGLGRDAGREREFFRRFMHLGRAVGSAPGNLVAQVHGADDGAVLTFSVWEELSPALDWAYAQPMHAGAVARQQSHRLVETSGFLRCAVLSSRGVLGDTPDPLAGRTGRVVPALSPTA